MSKVGRVLFLLYQWLIAGPIFIVATFITATITITGCTIGNRDFWGITRPASGQDSFADFFCEGYSFR